jgi:hypothetical protein
MAIQLLAAAGIACQMGSKIFGMLGCEQGQNFFGYASDISRLFGEGKSLFSALGVGFGARQSQGAGESQGLTQAELDRMAQEGFSRDTLNSPFAW